MIEIFCQNIFTFEPLVTFMRQKIGKKLIRAIVLLLSLQLLLPALVHANASDQDLNHELSLHHTPQDHGILLSLFLNENNEQKESENENERSFIAAELLDFSFLKVAIADSHTRFMPALPDAHIYQVPLHKAICIFLI